MRPDEDDESGARPQKHKQPSRGVSAALGVSRPKAPDRCGRCTAKVTDETRESCHICAGPLCTDCYDTYGDCGHLHGRAG